MILFNRKTYEAPLFPPFQKEGEGGFRESSYKSPFIPLFQRGKIVMMLFLLTFTLFSPLVLPQTVHAQGARKESAGVPEPRIKIPGFEPQGKFTIQQEEIDGYQTGRKYIDIPWLAQYINAIYKFVLGAIGILAVTMIIIGGIVWTTAGGDSGKVTKAKEFIGGAIMGVFLALLSFTILNTINPNLVALKPLRVPIVEKIALVGKFCDETTENVVRWDEEEQLVFRRAAIEVYESVDRRDEGVTGEEMATYTREIAFSGNYEKWTALDYSNYNDPNASWMGSSDFVQETAKPPPPPPRLACGIPYFYAVKKGDSKAIFKKDYTCWGRVCDNPAFLCTHIEGNGKQTKYRCRDRIFEMTVEDDGRPINDSSEWLFAVCGRNEDGRKVVNNFVYIGKGVPGKEAKNIWTFTASGVPADLSKACQEMTFTPLFGRDPLETFGLFMIIEVYDDDSIGYDQNDFFIIGETACNGGKAFYTSLSNELEFNSDVSAESSAKRAIQQIIDKKGGVISTTKKRCSININNENFKSDSVQDLQ